MIPEQNPSRPTNHYERQHRGNQPYDLDWIRQHCIREHGQQPEGVLHAAPNQLIILHDSGSFGDHTDPLDGSTSSFSEQEKITRLQALEGELLELRTGMEMMAMGMRAMENELRNHVTSGPHHSHPEP